MEIYVGWMDVLFDDGGFFYCDGFVVGDCIFLDDDSVGFFGDDVVCEDL